MIRKGNLGAGLILCGREERTGDCHEGHQPRKFNPYNRCARLSGCSCTFSTRPAGKPQQTGSKQERPTFVLSGDYLDVLGMRMALGRGFLREEDQEAGSHPSAVVSSGFWQRKLGSDPAAVGRRIVTLDVTAR